MEQGVQIHREVAVIEVTRQEDGRIALQFGDRELLGFDFVVLAVPWMRITRLLAPQLLAVIDPQNKFATIPSSPISSVHLWLDRQITALPHAVVVERLAQWVFARPSKRGASEHCYQVVISASSDLVARDRQAIVDEVMADLQIVFPNARSAHLLRWQLITDQQAVFSVRPGLDAIRPPQPTAIPNLLLAGDWTQTGWPATMEGAVRSGYLAAEALFTRLGRPKRILVPDLPRNWITKTF
jgi:predicted NAD/FAD-dependent oxidoreductase